MVPFQMMVYVEELAAYVPQDEVPEGARVLNISGTELRKRLVRRPRDPELVHLPRHRHRAPQELPAPLQAGLHGVLHRPVRLRARAPSPTCSSSSSWRWAAARSRSSTVTWSASTSPSELGFSKEHRDINIRRIGYVASEITKNGGIAICAPIAPYDQTRKDVRADDRRRRRLHPRPRRHLARGVRGPRPQGLLRQGPGRDHQGVHRHLRPLRRAARRRTGRSTRRTTPPRKQPRRSSCTLSGRVTSVPSDDRRRLELGRVCRNSMAPHE